MPSAPDPDRVLGPVVVVARDLTPSEAAQLQGRNVGAIALEQGGHTSHTAVILKSLEIPCVMGVRELLARVVPGQMVWVNGSEGRIVVDPDAADLEQALDLGRRYERLEATLLRGEEQVREHRDRGAALDDPLHRDELCEELVALEPNFHVRDLSDDG